MLNVLEELTLRNKKSLERIKNLETEKEKSKIYKWQKRK
jgi:hypothetical protein